MTTPREQLKEILNRPQHAPMNTHNGADGSCLDCPWPLHTLSPDHIADAIIAAGWQPPPTPPLTRPSQTIPYLDN